MIRSSFLIPPCSFGAVVIIVAIIKVAVATAGCSRISCTVNAFITPSHRPALTSTHQGPTLRTTPYMHAMFRCAGPLRDTRLDRSRRHSVSLSPPSSSTTTQLLMIRDLLSGLMGNSSGENNKKNNNNDPAAAAGGGTVIVDIPAKVVKVGPLKFYLQIYLVGEQNKPTKGSWFLKPNDESGTLDMYFGDGTAILSINVQDGFGIQISRQGQRPSLQYMLQESVLLHGVLDELQILAFGTGDDDSDNTVDDNVDDIATENRLLQFSDEQKDVLSKAKQSLPARREGI